VPQFGLSREMTNNTRYTEQGEAKDETRDRIRSCVDYNSFGSAVSAKSHQGL